jgi:hypothetical protein
MVSSVANNGIMVVGITVSKMAKQRDIMVSRVAIRWYHGEKSRQMVVFGWSDCMATGWFHDN